MRAKLSSRAATPLVEILIVLFFFAFVCTVILEMFASADHKSVLSSDINKASIVAQNYAEQLRGHIGDSDVGIKLLSGFEKASSGSGESYTLPLDSSWNAISGGAAVQYTVEVKIDPEKQNIISGDITVYRNEIKDGQKEILIELPISDYDPE